MCNLSEVVLEKGIEQGMRQLIQQMRNNGKNTKEIADFCGIPRAHWGQALENGNKVYKKCLNIL